MKKLLFVSIICKPVQEKLSTSRSLIFYQRISLKKNWSLRKDLSNGSCAMDMCPLKNSRRSPLKIRIIFKKLMRSVRKKNGMHYLNTTQKLLKITGGIPVFMKLSEGEISG